MTAIYDISHHTLAQHYHETHAVALLCIIRLVIIAGDCIVLIRCDVRLAVLTKTRIVMNEEVLRLHSSH